MSGQIRYTREVGRKFHLDGSPRLFPGNTIICFTPPSAPLYQAAAAFHDRLRRRSFGHKFALLPPSSFHMTVMDLLCDQVRVAERWSSALPLDLDLVASDDFFLMRVPEVAPPPHVSMHYRDFFCRVVLAINLTPADDQVAEALRSYREAIAEASGVRFPDHNAYQFHMTLAYRLLELEADEQRELEQLVAEWEAELPPAARTLNLPAPQLTFFDDMTRFVGAAERHTLASRASA